jgi:hypothetical protein
MGDDAAWLRGAWLRRASQGPGPIGNLDRLIANRYLKAVFGRPFFVARLPRLETRQARAMFGRRKGCACAGRGRGQAAKVKTHFGDLVAAPRPSRSPKPRPSGDERPRIEAPAATSSQRGPVSRSSRRDGVRGRPRGQPRGRSGARRGTCPGGLPLSAAAFLATEATEHRVPTARNENLATTRATLSEAPPATGARLSLPTRARTDRYSGAVGHREAAPQARNRHLVRHFRPCRRCGSPI